jgi:protoporphyrin/coproporphyrin ferrochelatase
MDNNNDYNNKDNSNKDIGNNNNIGTTQEPVISYSSAHRYGVLLLNMGGPQSEAEIYDYLYRLFSDPFIVHLPGFLRRRFAKIIARLRRKKAAARYAQIGGKSPLNEETATQAKKLEEVLHVPVTFAMHYSEPFVYSAQRDLEDRGVNRLIVLPLYPQYCHATTMSALEDFIEHRGNDVAYRFIEQHYNSPAYNEAMSHLLAETLRKIDDNLVTRVLFVAHSIPMRLVRDGDPYVEQVQSTMASITQQKSIPYSYALAFQSRLGPMKWQGPTLSEVLQQFRQEQVEQVVVHPLSFVVENLETLYDLDIQFQELCRNSGIKKYFRVPALGSHPLYIHALATLVKEEIDNWEVHHVQ